ncbi:MAG: nucleotidyltransferase family protein [Chloracidobacterium sp.]|nr:nucleotidyltransferase family protein [Chloracidobacterium sp.]
MMDINPLLNRLISICRDNDIGMLGVFGSVARGQDKPDSDVDLLVRLDKPVGLFKFFDIEDSFSKVLGRRVDLATESSLHPLIRGSVLADLKIVYEK